MKALIVYESMFGNTEQIARAVAEGLAESVDVQVAEVADAPS
jgi:flavodoxin